MDQLIHIAVFAGQALILVIAIGAVLVLFFSLLMKAKQVPQLEVENLNDRWKSYGDLLKQVAWVPQKLKDSLKAEKKKLKTEKKDKNAEKKNIFLLNFHGDIKASAVEQLRDEVTTILSAANPKVDEVVLKLESPGGQVHAYGLAASQLVRIKDAGLKLTVCVDKVAASGGYLMACVGDQILAAPFAILGSIGVIAQVPNFNRLLKKHDVDYEEFTSGEYKRTVSLLGEITPKGREKFLEQIQDTHLLFKKFVKHARPELNLEEVGTGEYWFGTQALELKLIDGIKTSDAYLFERREDFQILRVEVHAKKKIGEKLASAFALGAEKVWQKVQDEQNKNSLL